MYGSHEQSGKLPPAPGGKFAKTGFMAHQVKGPPKLDMHNAIRARNLARGPAGASRMSPREGGDRSV